MRADPRRTGVLVAGGGPAGLAAAIACRLAGLDTMVADPRRPPLDKACGEGIMPDGAELLERMGVVPPAAAVHPFHGITFIEGGLRAGARFRGRPGLAMRRSTLHAALASRAEALGARLLWECPVEISPDGPARVGGRPVAARWIVAADGPGFPARRRLGLEAPARFRRLGLRRHYGIRPWSDRVEVHWSDRCEAYVTPVDREHLNVALLLRDPSLTFDEALELFPDLLRRLDASAAGGDERGARYSWRRLPRVTRGDAALLGDASGSVDAVTGLGVTLALHQAALLAWSLRRGSLEPYEASHRRLSRLAHGMSRLLGILERRPALRRGCLRALDAIPGLFPLLLRLHARDLPGVFRGGLDGSLRDMAAHRPAGTQAA